MHFLDKIKSNFESLHLTENKVEVLRNTTEDETKDIYNNINLDINITGKELASDIKKYPKLEAFLKHCAVQRNYFFSIKKCGESDRAMCSPQILLPSMFEKLYHLPDPMPDEPNEGLRNISLHKTKI